MTKTDAIRTQDLHRFIQIWAKLEPEQRRVLLLLAECFESMQDMIDESKKRMSGRKWIAMPEDVNGKARRSE